MHGIYRMSEAQLRQAYDRAMKAEAFAVAERIAAFINEPRCTYVFSPARDRAA